MTEKNHANATTPPLAQAGFRLTRVVPKESAGSVVEAVVA